MKAYTYIEKGRFALTEKPKPSIQEATDALVRVTLSSICTSDLHIKHGSVPRAVPGITVGHEMVGVVEAVGKAVNKVKVSAIRHNRFAIHELGYAILFCHIVYSSVLFVAFPNTGAKVQ